MIRELEQPGIPFAQCRRRHFQGLDNFRYLAMCGGFELHRQVPFCQLSDRFLKIGDCAQCATQRLPANKAGNNKQTEQYAAGNLDIADQLVVKKVEVQIEIYETDQRFRGIRQ